MGNAACGEQVSGVPCFNCIDDGECERQRRMPHSTTRTLSSPGYEVELAISPLAGLKGAAGYHSSILIQGEEYFFSPMGIIHSAHISSHKKNPQMQRIFVGLSRYSGSDLVEFFDHHFPPGHYDLLRKNCNCFSDAAMYFLCEQRLEMKYRYVERFGKLADDHAGLIQSISGGEYLPNPQAVGFDLEELIKEIDSERPAFDEANADNDVGPLTPPVVAGPETHRCSEGALAGAKFVSAEDLLATDPENPNLIDFRNNGSLRSSASPVSGVAPLEDINCQQNTLPHNSVQCKAPIDDVPAADGPTDPLGITLAAPMSHWQPPVGRSARSPKKGDNTKGRPLTWNELRIPPDPYLCAETGDNGA